LLEDVFLTMADPGTSTMSLFIKQNRLVDVPTDRVEPRKRRDACSRLETMIHECGLYMDVCVHLFHLTVTLHSLS
jgi:hypothetical protein